MRTLLPALASSALFFGSLLAAPPDEATPKAPDAKVGTRLKFMAYEKNPQRPESRAFQINVLDGRKPADFVGIGDTINKTNFKLVNFVYKERKNLKTGELEDVSELTIINTATKLESVLVLNQPTSVP
jgi:hypothetical protein